MDDAKQQILSFIETEGRRLQYGKLLVEVTVHKGALTNVQCETRKSMNINHA